MLLEYIKVEIVKVHKNKGIFIGFILDELEKEDFTKKKDGKIIKLHCKLGIKNILIIQVLTSDYLNILFSKLNIENKETKLLFKGETHEINNYQTF